MTFDETRMADPSASEPATQPAPKERAIPAAAIVGRYVVLARIGAGGMGVVYAAYDPSLDRKVALKLLRPAAAGSRDSSADQRRLLREAQAMARLSHPNVITVHDVGTFEDQVFVAMEFVDGGTLREWIAHKARTWTDVLGAYLLAGRGLAAAHASGLVHRDFKPDNVLIGTDGRVRVADFGLARPLTLTEPARPAEPHEALSDTEAVGSPFPFAAAATQEVLAGTPAYMSPEQILGQSTDARSDQYSFCVSLWEGLYGSRPFAGETPAALAMQAAQGKFVGPPADTRVPARLRRILTRGLAAEREQRHPSIDALLTELARDPRHLRRRVLLALGAAALVAVGVGVVSEIRARQRAVCSGAERKLAGIWDGPRKDAIRAAFLASGKPFAQDAWKGTERAFDAYARGFVETRTEACQATRIRGEQSEALLDVRMRCLDQRLKEMSALATVFSSADGEVVAKAVHAANAITPLEVCADVDGLMVFKRPRPDPQIRPRVDALRARLAEAKALRDAGKHREGLKVAAEADREARALGYGPLEAEARYLLGSLQVQTASYRDAEQTLFDALSVAEASWQDRLRALVLRSLVEVVGVKQQRHSEARRWARYAAASIQRLGGDPFLEALLWTNVAVALMSEGRYEEALSRARSALAIYERALGRDHPRVATELNNIGIVLAELGRYEEAERLHRRALALRVRIFGASHPDVGQSNNNLANVLMETGRLEEARQGYERALSIYEGSLGAEHPRVASALNNVGLAEVGLGELSKARLRYERALAIFTRVHGREHPNVGMARLNLGEVLGKLGQPAEALRHLRAASEILEKTRGPDHPDLAESLQAQGLFLLSQRDHAAARALFERSLAIRQKALGGNHPKLVDSLTGLAEASLELGAVARAVAFLERALTIGQATKDAAPALARTRFALARALLSTTGERARAVELARRARAEYASAGKHAEDLAKVDAWLARHARR